MRRIVIRVGRKTKAKPPSGPPKGRPPVVVKIAWNIRPVPSIEPAVPVPIPTVPLEAKETE